MGHLSSNGHFFWWTFIFPTIFYTNSATLIVIVTQFCAHVHVLSFFISDSLYWNMTCLRAGCLSLVLHITEPSTFNVVGVHWCLNEWWTNGFVNEQISCVTLSVGLPCVSRSFKIFESTWLLLEIKNINSGSEMK